VLPSIYELQNNEEFVSSTSVPRPELPPRTYDDRLDLPDSLSFPIDINKPELLGFVDAAYANDLHKRHLTTGYCFTFCVGAVVYRSKNQGINGLSSEKQTELSVMVQEKNENNGIFFYHNQQKFD